jgi:hypothetical protein
VRIYAFSVLTTAFSAPTTRLRGWCTPKALTNQGGRTHQYIDHVVCFNTSTSHHLYKHTILHIFHARRYDSNYTIKLVQTLISVYTNLIIQFESYLRAWNIYSIVCLCRWWLILILKQTTWFIYQCVLPPWLVSALGVHQPRKQVVGALNAVVGTLNA